MAWWTTQIQSQIQLHIGSTKLDLVLRLTARLESSDVALCWRVRWLGVDMACQLCMLTSHLHNADVILGMLTVHDDVPIASCWRHHYPGQARGSGRLVFGSGQPIRAKMTRVTRGTCLCAWPATPPARDGTCGRFRRPISTLFSPVASSLPPLHSGMVKTQFGQLLFLSKNQTPL
jgi:hypothetical protein